MPGAAITNQQSVTTQVCGVDIIKPVSGLHKDLQDGGAIRNCLMGVARAFGSDTIALSNEKIEFSRSDGSRQPIALEPSQIRQGAAGGRCSDYFDQIIPFFQLFNISSTKDLPVLQAQAGKVGVIDSRIIESLVLPSQTRLELQVLGVLLDSIRIDVRVKSLEYPISHADFAFANPRMRIGVDIQATEIPSPYFFERLRSDPALSTLATFLGQLKFAKEEMLIPQLPDLDPSVAQVIIDALNRRAVCSRGEGLVRSSRFLALPALTLQLLPAELEATADLKAPFGNKAIEHVRNLISRAANVGLRNNDALIIPQKIETFLRHLIASTEFPLEDIRYGIADDQIYVSSAKGRGVVIGSKANGYLSLSEMVEAFHRGEQDIKN